MLFSSVKIRLDTWAQCVDFWYAYPLLFCQVLVHLVSKHVFSMARRNGQYWDYAAQQGFKRMQNGINGSYKRRSLIS